MGIVFTSESVAAKLLITGKMEEHVLIAVPNQPWVDTRIADHVDLSIFVGDRIYCAPNQYDLVFSRLSESFDEEWVKFHLVKGNRIPKSGYPMDIPYNGVSISGKLFHNLEHTDSSIVAGYGGKKINISQGYAKCSCLRVGENAVITEDPGVEKGLINCGVDVLRIERGGVLLEGFEYGFIGGAGGLVGSTLFMNGKLTSHPEYHLIEPFLVKQGTELVEIYEGPLVDCGSILYFEL